MKSNISHRIATIIAVVSLVLPISATAGTLVPRSVTLGSSGSGAVTTNRLDFTTETAASIGSIKFQYCTTASGACVTPTGLSTVTATLTSQTGAVGFTLNATTNGAPFITRVGVLIPASTALVYTLAGVHNPSNINTSFNVRITTFAGSDGVTGPVDLANVAVSTAEQVNLSGTTPEILIFCVGTAMPTDCTSVTGNAVDFGDFSPLATRTGTSVMQAQTNAAFGYAITVTGTTLSSGANTIPALGALTPSQVGTSQFGINLRANTAPTVGADVQTTTGGTATYGGQYGTPNSYKFVNSDTVAGSAGPTNSNTFTSSYIVNIGGIQAAGVYTTTMTYICTATF